MVLLKSDKEILFTSKNDPEARQKELKREGKIDKCIIFLLVMK